MSQLEAIDKSITALGSSLRPEHGALVEAARGLAEAVDADTTNASLWKQYRESIEALLGAAPDASEDDGKAALLSLVRPPLGNAKNTGKKDAGAGARSGVRKPRPTPDAVAAPSRGRRPRTSA